jgi:hypothetical protein
MPVIERAFFVIIAGYSIVGQDLSKDKTEEKRLRE